MFYLETELACHRVTPQLSGIAFGRNIDFASKGLKGGNSNNKMH
jgi:hypothetical protein